MDRGSTDHRLSRRHRHGGLDGRFPADGRAADGWVGSVHAPARPGRRGSAIVLIAIPRPPPTCSSRASSCGAGIRLPYRQTAISCGAAAGSTLLASRSTIRRADRRHARRRLLSLPPLIGLSGGLAACLSSPPRASSRSPPASSPSYIRRATGGAADAAQLSFDRSLTVPIRVLLSAPAASIRPIARPLTTC